MVVDGDAMPSTERYAADPADGAIVQVSNGLGDGLVLRDSALLDARQRPGSGRARDGGAQPDGFPPRAFLPHEHLAITRDPVLRNNILFWLLEKPRLSLRQFKLAGTTAPASLQR